MRELTGPEDTGPDPGGGPGRFAVPYDKGGICRACADVLRHCCGRHDGDTPMLDGLCCECQGYQHTASRPGQEAVTILPGYL